jgi:hypothetical protein
MGVHMAALFGGVCSPFVFGSFFRQNNREVLGRGQRKSLQEICVWCREAEYVHECLALRHQNTKLFRTFLLPTAHTDLPL